jgi:hypothetical protein
VPHYNEATLSFKRGSHSPLAHAILKQRRFERDRLMAYVVFRISQSDMN